MGGFLKDGRFWAGVLVGYLLVVFVPQLSIKGRMSAKSGA
jgi:hypothetical protein